MVYFSMVKNASVSEVAHPSLPHDARLKMYTVMNSKKKTILSY